MANREELKATFSGGNQINESDFGLLIDSLAHLADDSASGAIASGADISALNQSIAQAQALAQEAKDTVDGFGSTHPSTVDMSDADTALENSLNSSILSVSNSLSALSNLVSANKVELNTKINGVDTELTSSVLSNSSAISGLATKAETTYVDGIKNNLESGLASKAEANHSHPEFATKVSIASFITASDLPNSAPAIHGHPASEISGLYDLFSTPAQVDAKIAENVNTLDQVAQLYDIFYDKEEVDQKFYTARWRPDQISLFNESIVSIAQPFVDLAKQEIEVSIAQVRVSLFADKTSILSDLASTRSEIEVSINNTKSTVELNRLHSELKRVSIQGGIDQLNLSVVILDNNLKASIYTTRVDALAAVSSLRADTVVSDATTLTSANVYTDTQISGLLNGAGDAYNTLKELQDHITTNESSAALALTNQVGLLQTQITANDGDLSGLAVSLGNIHGLIDAVELRATNLEASDTTIQSSFSTLQANFNTLELANTALTASYNTLLQKITTLENTAYAQAGYTFP